MFLVIMLIMSLLINVVLAYALYIFVRKSLELRDNVELLSTNIESSLDVLDTTFKTVSSVLSQDVISDEPNVRMVVESMKTARDAIASSAISLVKGTDADE